VGPSGLGAGGTATTCYDTVFKTSCDIIIVRAMRRPRVVDTEHFCHSVFVF